MSVTFPGSNLSYVTIEELSQAVGYSASHLRNLTRDNKIPAYRRGRRWYYVVEDVKRALFEPNGHPKAKVKLNANDPIEDLMNDDGKTADNQ